jgi:hypothetical protein
MRAADAVASDGYGKSVEVGLHDLAELPTSASGLAKESTYSDSVYCAVRAVGFKRHGSAAPSVYPHRPGSDPHSTNSQAVLFAQRLFDACPEADFVEVQLWGADGRPEPIDGVKSLRAGVVPRSRDTSRSVAFQASLAEISVSESWTERLTAQAKVTKEMVRLLESLPARLFINDNARRRREWGEQVNSLGSAVAALPHRPAEAVRLLSPLEASQLDSSARALDMTARSNQTKDIERKALQTIADTLVQVSRNQDGSQAQHGAASRLLDAYKALQTARLEARPTLTGLGETLPITLDHALRDAAVLLSALDQPQISRVLTGRTLTGPKLLELAREASDRAAADTTKALELRLRSADCTVTNIATMADEDPIAPWLQTQVVAAIDPATWPDAMASLLTWDSHTRELDGLRSRVQAVACDGLELLPIGVRLDGPYGKALPLQPNDLASCAVVLGVTPHRGDWWETLQPLIEELTELSYGVVRHAARDATWARESPSTTTTTAILDRTRLLREALLSGRDVSELTEEESAAWHSLQSLDSLVEQVAHEDGSSTGLAGALARIDFDTMDLAVTSEAGDTFKEIFGLSVAAAGTTVGG